MKKIFLFLLLFQTLSAAAQTPHQTIRGTVQDKLSREPLPGAIVILIDSSMSNAISTDANGQFRFSKIPVGVQRLQVSLLGFRQQHVQVTVTSGKEIVLVVELEPMVFESSEVQVIAERKKDKANNEMSTVSARSFTFDETSRYAGTLLDPSRMAMNYAGVSGANDARNDLIIRGNSPIGLLWRLNDVDIPNPNHFGSLGVTGGPISILNNNTLDKSDFMTGAFPAEYGNALAGAFDLKMRSGNNEQHEFLGQIGFNGLEAGAEGPLSKKSRASYLINYRYSTLGIFSALGFDIGTGSAVPLYQDLSMNIDIPTQSAGKFTVFAIGGISYAETLDKDRDSTKENIYDNDFRQDGTFGTNMGAAGLTHLYFFNNNTFSRFSFSASTTGQDYRIDSIDVANDQPLPWYRGISNQQKYSARWVLSYKQSAKNYYKAGVQADLVAYHYADSLLDGPSFKVFANTDGSAFLYQAFVQWQHKFSNKFSIVPGLHAQLLGYNATFAVEPRIGLRWEPSEGQSFSFGSGVHNQLQPYYTYFQETKLNDGSFVKTNKDLQMTSSLHFVLAYDQSFSNNIRVKSETYYQHLYNVPIEARSTYYSILNDGADFGISPVDSLVNKGTGKNYGFEVTVEKFYSKGFYLLLTASLFESKYKGSDGIERNTAFNGNYTVNFLTGKEWTIRKKNVIGINLRTVAAGGKRYIPIDFEESYLQQKAVYIESQAYENHYPDYFRTDFKLSYRINRKKVTHEIAVDINNVFNRKNIWQRLYDVDANRIKTEYQVGLLPIPLYRVTF